jgi:hypothetical protein
MVIRIPKAAHLRSAAEPQLTSPPARHLTVKLRGRPEAPPKRRGRILSSRARGAQAPTVHGPLQRLLDGFKAPLMPNTRYPLQRIKHIAAVVHRGTKYFSAPLAIFQLVGREWMMEFPGRAQKPFKHWSRRESNHRADAKFRGIVAGTLRGHHRSRLTGKLSGARSFRRQTKALYPELRHVVSLSGPTRATAPTIVRGRHKPAYCARAEVSVSPQVQRNEGTALKALNARTTARTRTRDAPSEGSSAPAPSSSCLSR